MYVNINIGLQKFVRDRGETTGQPHDSHSSFSDLLAEAGLTRRVQELLSGKVKDNWEQYEKFSESLPLLHLLHKTRDQERK
jgi:hypothetical protein